MLGVAPGGVCTVPVLPHARVSSYLTISPLPFDKLRVNLAYERRYVSVALLAIKKTYTCVYPFELWSINLRCADVICHLRFFNPHNYFFK